MNEYELSPAAERDLERIEAYITADNPTAAERIIDAIEAACQLVADHPGVGRHRDEIERSVRSFPVNSYLIYYVEETETLVGIARVLHERRDAFAAFHDV